MSQWMQHQVRRAARGDSSAITWLYQTFAPRLLRRLRARFGAVPALDPEDLLQDTFLYTLRHEGRALERFLTRIRATETDEEGPREPSSDDATSALDGFLWSAACGVASNRRRSALRHPAAPLESVRQTETAQDDEGSALARDALERLAACLANRGDALQLYFQFRYVDGLTPAEIVHATGWSRKKTYKLKQSLDEALERCMTLLGLP